MINVIILIVLVLINAFFSGSEIALISLNKKKLKLESEEGNRKSTILYRLVNVPNRLLSVIQVGVTLSGFLNSALASDAFADNLVELMQSLGLSIHVSAMRSISMALITILLSFLTLIFGELVPKRIAMANPTKFANAVAMPINILYKLFLPFVYILSFCTNGVLRLLRIDPNKNDDLISEEEIRLMVATSSEEGEINVSEREMIDNIFEFNDTEVNEVMTHRVDVEGLEVHASYEEVMDYSKSSRYTRIPVYDETLDDVVGILHAKDLLRYIYENKDAKDFDLQKIIQQPLFVPDSLAIDKLFYDLKKQHKHMAIVIDEYGGTAGIVTMEDLIEEIVGEVFDEYDEIPVEYRKIGDHTYLMEGSIELDEVEKILKIQLPIDEYDTLNGFLVSKLERLPHVGDNAYIDYSGYRFTITQVDEKVIKQARVEKMDDDQEEVNEEDN
ncbi:hemolysin [Erysipelotrichaceae bacterium MTC7]|nr:hemolysin [Erysipelotrichaceae bacterium MTC7]